MCVMEEAFVPIHMNMCVCVCRYDTCSHILINTLCVYRCVYSCIYVCVLSGELHTLTHTHLSRRVRFSPNGTMGTRDISILKGDISQSEPCSRVQPDHSDSLTATQEGQRTDTSDCGVQYME